MARSLTEGALLAAVTVVLALATAYVPIAGWIAAILMPTPTAVLVVRHDARTAVLSAVVAGILLFVLLGPIGASLALIQIVGIGLPLGLGVKAAWQPWKTVAGMAVGFFLASAASLAVSLWIGGFNPLELALESYRGLGAFAAEVYERAGRTPPGAEDAQAFIAMWDEVVETATRLLPVGFISGFFLFALMTYSLNQAIFKRLGVETPSVLPFARWQLPLEVLYVFIGTLVLMWLWPAAQQGTLAVVFENITFGFILIFAVNGLATAYAFLRHWGMYPAMAVVFLATLTIVLIQPIAWLGMFEAVLRLRERYLPQVAGEGDLRDEEPRAGEDSS